MLSYRCKAGFQPLSNLKMILRNFYQSSGYGEILSDFSLQKEKAHILEGACCLSDIFDIEQEALLTCNIYVQWSLSVINVLIKYDITPGVSISYRIFNCVYSNSFLVRELCKSDHLNSRWSELKDCRVHICSENNFPTAAGLASSAAGYSCLGTCVRIDLLPSFLNSH